VTEERLKQLAQRASHGNLTISEQRELVILHHAVCLLAADFASKLAEHSRFTHTRRALLNRSNELQALASAAALEPLREKCEACSGTGSAYPQHEIQCSKCHGTGYAKERE
jgi:hypothetical protein